MFDVRFAHIQTVRQRYEVDQRPAGAQLHQPYALDPALFEGTHHIAVEPDRPVHVAHAQDNVIEFPDFEWHRSHGEAV